MLSQKTPKTTPKSGELAQLAWTVTNRGGSGATQSGTTSIRVGWTIKGRTKLVTAA